ncbi:hypothetical protein STAT_600 [Blattabacterium cuenoti STAT]|uniref:Transmembrane protein n=1 Tax=Blattabacterium cuenoti STAT TaxID=1457030 RepID=A0A224AKR6_9FLAO|nr:hypothetical protein STAT_600 [Blattabacterium cuenoti STAT]
MSFSKRIILFFTGVTIGILILLFFSYQKRLLNIKKKKIVKKKDEKYFSNIQKTNNIYNK